MALPVGILTFLSAYQTVQNAEVIFRSALTSETDFKYDVFDRRIEEDVDPDGSGPQPVQMTRYAYDGSNVWADFDAAGNVTARYLFGDGANEILARFRPGEGTSWYLTDRLGTVRDIANAQGAVVDHLDYDSYGNVVLETDPSLGDRFRFAGMQFDPATGLYYDNARYYGPQLGRFISQDPLSFGAGDTNLYRYVGNSPTLAIDPTGLEIVSDAAIGISAVKVANAAAGFALGWACGYLEGVYRGDPDPAVQALTSAVVGSAIGFALGAAPLDFQTFVGIEAAIYAIGSADDIVIVGMRVTCLAVQFGASHAINSLANRIGHARIGAAIKNFAADESGAIKIPGTPKHIRRNVNDVDAFADIKNFLGKGAETDVNPFTGKKDMNRIFSRQPDGEVRSVRIGSHEIKNPNDQHYHLEE